MLNKSIFVEFGYGEEDITPDWTVELVGFSRISNMSKGVLHKLNTQVLFCKKKDENCCLITIDSLGFTVELTNKLRDLIANNISCSREKVMVCFSHTHAAPNAGTDKQYYDFVCNRVLSAVKKAQNNVCRLNAAWTVAEGNIGINRRENVDIVDNRLGILKLSDIFNKPKLLLLRVTAHANVLSSDNYKISSDYFGITREMLEDKYGCKVMMIQGAAGDIRPKYQQDNALYLEVHGFEASFKEYAQNEKEDYFRQSQEALSKMANSILQSIDNVFDNMVSVPVYRLTMFSKYHLFFADVPDMHTALKIADEAQREAGIDGTHWLQEVRRLNENNVHSQKSDIEFQFFVLNEACICGIANEVMCEIALDIKKRSNYPLLLFCGYINGINSYLSTADEYDKGGYEVLWSNLVYFKYHGRVMPFNRDTAEEIAKFVSDIWKEFFL